MSEVHVSPIWDYYIVILFHLSYEPEDDSRRLPQSSGRKIVGMQCFFNGITGCFVSVPDCVIQVSDKWPPNRYDISGKKFFHSVNTMWLWTDNPSFSHFESS